MKTSIQNCLCPDWKFFVWKVQKPRGENYNAFFMIRNKYRNEKVGKMM